MGTLKRVDDLRVYRGFMMPQPPGRLQGTLKQCLTSRQSSIASHLFSVCPNGICFDARSIHKSQ